jgi:hypothetical protein
MPSLDLAQLLDDIRITQHIDPYILEDAKNGFQFQEHLHQYLFLVFGHIDQWLTSNATHNVHAVIIKSFIA